MIDATTPQRACAEWLDAINRTEDLPRAWTYTDLGLRCHLVHRWFSVVEYVGENDVTHALAADDGPRHPVWQLFAEPCLRSLRRQFHHLLAWDWFHGTELLAPGVELVSLYRPERQKSGLLRRHRASSTSASFTMSYGLDRRWRVAGHGALIYEPGLPPRPVALSPTPGWDLTPPSRG